MQKKKPRPMRIIIEGLDRCGKSTLIQGLRAHYKYPFVCLHHGAPPFKDVQMDIKYEIELYSNMFQIFNMFDYVIADRSHLGSLVYSPLYRGHDGTHVMTDERLLPDDTILITLIDDPANLINRDDGLSFSTNTSSIETEVKLFIDAHNTSTIKNKLLFNIKMSTIIDVKTEVIAFINSKQ